MLTKQKKVLDKITKACNSKSQQLLHSTMQMQDKINILTPNGSVCAANTQIAANAVVKLASDLGSINAIVLSADFNTAIHKEITKIRELTNKATYSIEKALELGMEISMFISELTKVSNKAKVIDIKLKELEKIITSNIQQQESIPENALVVKPKNILKHKLQQKKSAYHFSSTNVKRDNTLANITKAISETQASTTKLQGEMDVLSQEQGKYTHYLALALNYDTQAKSNKELALKIVKDYTDFANDTSILSDQMLSVTDRLPPLPNNLKKIMLLLQKVSKRYSVLSKQIINTKSLNPLIAKDLVSLVTQTATDAISAIVVTNVSVQSAVQLRKDYINSKVALDKVQKQSSKLMSLLNGKTKPTLQSVFIEAVKEAENDVRLAHRIIEYYNKKITETNRLLTNTNTKLLSLQATHDAYKAAERI